MKLSLSVKEKIMQNNKNKIQKNFIYSLLAQIITISLGIIIPRITIVGYGSSVNGLLSSVGQIVAYLILFEAGIKSVAQQTLYKTLAHNDFKATNEVLSAVNKNYKKIGTAYFLCLLGLAVVYPAFVKIAELNYFSVFLIVMLSGLGNVVSFFITGKYNILVESDGRAYVTANLSTIINILTQVSKIVLIYLGVPVTYVVISTFLIHMLQNVCLYIYVKIKYKWIDLSSAPDYSGLTQSKHAFVHQVSTLIFRNTDVLLLTIFTNLKTVSVYAMYKLIFGYMYNLISIPLNSCNFAMGQLFNRDKRTYIKCAEFLEIGFNTGVFAIFTVAAMLILPFLRLYTSGVTDVNYIDRFVAILFIATEVLDLIRMPSLRTINYAKHFKETLSRSLFETVINIVVSIVGVILFGIYGVLLGTFVALLYRTCDIIIYANKKILDKSPVKVFVSIIINTIVMCGSVFIYNRFHISISNYFDFIVNGIVLTTIVLLIFLTIAILFLKPNIKLFLSILKSGKKAN